MIGRMQKTLRLVSWVLLSSTPHEPHASFEQWRSGMGRSRGFWWQLWLLASGRVHKGSRT